MINPVKRIAGLRRRLKIAGAKLRSKIVLARFLECSLLVHANEDVGRSILAGDFEIDDMRYFREHICAGDVVLDVGANIGVYSVTCGRHHADAKIFAFEPIPTNAELIRVSILLNGIGNVQVIQKCIADYSGKTQFSISSDSAYSSMINTGRKSEQQIIQVETVRLDDYCTENGIHHVALMKIDVEGAEELVINGARGLLAKHESPRLILMELYGQNLTVFGSSIDKVVGMMTNYGYLPFVLIKGNRVAYEKQHHDEYYNVFFEKAERRS